MKIIYCLGACLVVLFDNDGVLSVMLCFVVLLVINVFGFNSLRSFLTNINNYSPFFICLNKFFDEALKLKLQSPQIIQFEDFGFLKK